MINQNADLQADLGPVSELERISSIDTIRGVALFGQSSKHENAKQPHWAQARIGAPAPPL